MLPLRELRTYVSALSVIPIAVMIANPVVLATFVSYLSSLAFFSAFGLIAVYLLLKQIGFIRSLSANVQVVFESFLLILPIIIPMFSIFATGNPSDFIAAFLAYLLIGTTVSLFRVVFGDGVGAGEGSEPGGKDRFIAASRGRLRGRRGVAWSRLRSPLGQGWPTTGDCAS